MQLDNKINEFNEKLTNVIESINSQMETKVSKKELGYVTPEMFGAKGDGVSSDYNAFQLAFDSGYNIKCSRGKKYNLLGGIIKVGKTSRILDLNSSQIIDSCFSYNLNSNNTDWDYGFNPECFEVCNGTIGHTENTRLHPISCVFLVGGYLKLKNLVIQRTPHLVAHAQRFIDHFVMENVRYQGYKSTAEDYKGLDCINVIRQADGVIQKSSDSIYSQGDGWLFKKVNEFHSEFDNNYRLVTLNYHQSLKFELCIQVGVTIGVRNVVTFDTCHFESLNTDPRFMINWVHDSNILFLNCSFISNYTILDKVCVNYRNCKFHIGRTSTKKWSEIFTKRLIEYSCTFSNCSSTELGVIDNVRAYYDWNTPLCCLMNNYFITELGKIKYKETSSDNVKNTPVGTYNITTFVHLSNDFSKAYYRIDSELNKTKADSNISNGYFFARGIALEIYVTYPDETIKVGWIRIPNIDKMTTLGDNAPRQNRILIANDVISLDNENPSDVIYDTMVTVSSIPTRTIDNTTVSKY